MCSEATRVRDTSLVVSRENHETSGHSTRLLHDVFYPFGPRFRAGETNYKHATPIIIIKKITQICAIYLHLNSHITLARVFGHVCIVYSTTRLFRRGRAPRILAHVLALAHLSADVNDARRGREASAPPPLITNPAGRGRCCDTCEFVIQIGFRKVLKCGIRALTFYGRGRAGRSRCGRRTRVEAVLGSVRLFVASI